MALTIDGAVDTPLDVTYDQLTSEFTAHSVVATLVCAGNRRAELLNVHPIPGKDPWAHGMIDRRMARSPGWPMSSTPLESTLMRACTSRSRPHVAPGSRPRAVLRQLHPAYQGAVGTKCCWPGR